MKMIVLVFWFSTVAMAADVTCGNSKCDFTETERTCAQDCKPTDLKPKIDYAMNDPKAGIANVGVVGIFGDKPNPAEAFQAGIFAETLAIKNPRECKRLKGVRAQKVEANGKTYSTVDGMEWLRFCLAVAKDDQEICKNVGDESLRTRCLDFFKNLTATKNSSIEHCLADVEAGRMDIKQGLDCISKWKGRVFGERTWVDVRDKAINVYFPMSYLDLGVCWEKKPESAGRCVDELAAKYRDKRFCRLSESPINCNKAF